MATPTVLVSDMRQIEPAESARLATELMALARASVVPALPAAPRPVEHRPAARSDYAWWGRERRPARFTWNRQPK